MRPLGSRRGTEPLGAYQKRGDTAGACRFFTYRPADLRRTKKSPALQGFLRVQPLVMVGIVFMGVVDESGNTADSGQTEYDAKNANHDLLLEEES